MGWNEHWCLMKSHTFRETSNSDQIKTISDDRTCKIAHCRVANKFSDTARHNVLYCQSVLQWLLTKNGVTVIPANHIQSTDGSNPRKWIKTFSAQWRRSSGTLGILVLTLGETVGTLAGWDAVLFFIACVFFVCSRLRISELWYSWMPSCIVCSL